MKKPSHILLLILFFSCSLQAESSLPKAARDPFWPIGYEPPPVHPAEKVVPVTGKPELPKPPPPEPVTADDWKMARKLLKINGYAVGEITSEGTAKKVARVIINLKHYNANDKIKLSHNGINFVWRVGPIDNRNVELFQESAERGAPEKKTATRTNSRKKPARLN